MPTAKEIIQSHIEPEFPLDAIRAITAKFQAGEALDLETGALITYCASWGCAWGSGSFDSEAVFGLEPDDLDGDGHVTQCYEAMRECYEAVTGEKYAVMAGPINVPMVNGLWINLLSVLIKIIQDNGGLPWIIDIIKNL